MNILSAQKKTNLNITIFKENFIWFDWVDSNKSNICLKFNQIKIKISKKNYNIFAYISYENI